MFCLSVGCGFVAFPGCVRVGKESSSRLKISRSSGINVGSNNPIYLSRKLHSNWPGIQIESVKIYCGFHPQVVLLYATNRSPSSPIPKNTPPTHHLHHGHSHPNFFPTTTNNTSLHHRPSPTSQTSNPNRRNMFLSFRPNFPSSLL